MFCVGLCTPDNTLSACISSTRVSSHTLGLKSTSWRVYRPHGSPNSANQNDRKLDVFDKKSQEIYPYSLFNTEIYWMRSIRRKDPYNQWRTNICKYFSIIVLYDLAMYLQGFFISASHDCKCTGNFMTRVVGQIAAVIVHALVSALLLW